MYCLKINKKNAQKIKEKLSQLNLIDFSYQIFSKDNFVFFVVKKISKNNLKELKEIQEDIKIEEIKKIEEKFKIKFKKKEFKKSIKEYLKDIKEIEKKEIENIIKSFDLLGNIAVLEVRKQHEKYEKKIAQALMKVHPTVKTVVKKIGPTSGEFRIRPVKVIFGENNTIVKYKENNYTFIFDINRVYFSPRLSFERQRILKQIKDKEKIIVLFAGVGPFALLLNKKAEQIIAIELNSHAYNYLKENIKLNKINNIKPYLMDANLAKDNFSGYADRILMPLPKGAEEFLKSVICCLKKKGGIIHLYGFCSEKEKEKNIIKKIDKECKNLKKNYKILNIREVRPYAPGIIQICIDFLVF